MTWCMPANKNQPPFGIVGKRSARSSYAARSNPVFSVFAERRGSRARMRLLLLRDEEKQKLKRRRCFCCRAASRLFLCAPMQRSLAARVGAAEGGKGGAGGREGRSCLAATRRSASSLDARSLPKSAYTCLDRLPMQANTHASDHTSAAPSHTQCRTGD